MGMMRGESREVTSLKVMREQRWVYEQRLARRTWHQIVADCTPALGYQLGLSTLRALHRTYLTEAIEQEERTREEHLHDAQAGLDALSAQIGAALTHDLRIASEHGEALSPIVLAAAKEQRAILEARRKLLGLDAAQRSEHEVTIKRDLDAEIAALMDMPADERITP